MLELMLDDRGEETLKRIAKEQGLTDEQSFNLLWSIGASLYDTFQKDVTKNIVVPARLLHEQISKTRLS